tara:strand:+ start:483 stop:824 length:342 start_codon:yes stop_codon:yes gene_type:complete
MSSKKKRKKKYFPNNYDAIARCPSEWFHAIPFDEFMDWKIHGYEIPSSINSIIREKRLDTGEITEYVYQSAGRAKNKARQIMDEGVSEFIVATAEGVHHLYPQQVPEYDDPLF